MQERSTPLISIIVPVYNVEKFIERCIDSIIMQSYRNIEIVLVDDGSPDRCPEICDDYARKDDRVKVIHQANAGLSAARNVGIGIASGEFIGFVDSDDYISADMFELLYSALAENDADMSICNFEYVGECETDLYDNTNMPIMDSLTTGIDIITHKLDTDKNWYWIVAWNKLHRRELFQDARYPDGKLHEDEFVIHKLLLKCSKVACVSKPLYYYLQRNSGITKSKYSIKRLDSAEAHFERTDMFLSKGINAQSAYYACSVGLMVMANSYTQLSFKDSSYKKRYDELTVQYRVVAKRLIKTKLPIFIKARLSLNCASPYYAWKFLERFMRNFKDKIPAEARDIHF